MASDSDSTNSLYIEYNQMDEKQEKLEEEQFS
jgi:DNA-dependent RNA polymerase auxiliary subunit epsilon